MRVKTELCCTVFGLKMGLESTGQARDHLPIYKLGLADPMFGDPELQNHHVRTEIRALELRDPENRIGEVQLVHMKVLPTLSSRF